MTISDALLTRLREQVTPVYDGEVKLDATGQPVSERYAVLYVSPGTRAAEDLTRTKADRFAFRWQVTSVGLSRTQAEWVAVRCRDAVMDAPLLAAGWELGAVEHSSSASIRRDDDLPGKSLFFAVDTYELTATR